jgi:hypothetical protein
MAVFDLLLMMKVTILHFENDTYIVNTALNDFVTSKVVLSSFYLQSHRYVWKHECLLARW